MRCAYSHDSGSYVLGALLSAEREAYEGHLSTCAACRNDVAELAVLPGLLSRLDLATVESLPPPFDAVPPAGTDEGRLLRAVGPVGGDGTEAAGLAHGDAAAGGAALGGAALGGAVPGGAAAGGGGGGGGRAPGGRAPTGGPVGASDLLSRARQRRAGQRRRRRWQTTGAALAAAVLVVLAFVGGRALTGPGGAEPNPTAEMALMTSVSQQSVVSGWVSVEEFEGGSRVRLRCVYTGGADGMRWTFRLVVVPRSGNDEQVGSWTAGYGKELAVEGTTAHDRTDIARIELRSGAGVPLLAYAP